MLVGAGELKGRQTSVSSTGSENSIPDTPLQRRPVRARSTIVVCRMSRICPHSHTL